MKFDLYCRVVDNFGDAGVCWRLARQLANEYGAQVRLIIDQAHLINWLASGTDATTQAPSLIDRVSIVAWDEDFSIARNADVIIAAFQCELPPSVRACVAADGANVPLWINLDYLSAELWVVSAHGRPSPKPSGGVEWFFMPGFDPASGGLLRDQFVQNAGDAKPAWLPGEPAGAFRMSLFTYPGQSLTTLCSALAMGVSFGGTAAEQSQVQPVQVLLMATKHDKQFDPYLNWPDNEPGPLQQGLATLHRVPWLAQAQYDQLLAHCHLNFVRGEDSWIRAIWACRPFVWLPYRQDDGSHNVKLEAFLARLAPHFEAHAFKVTAQLMRAWNHSPRPTQTDLAAALTAFTAHYPTVATGFSAFKDDLLMQSDLAERLIDFVRQRRPLL